MINMLYFSPVITFSRITPFSIGRFLLKSGQNPLIQLVFFFQWTNEIVGFGQIFSKYMPIENGIRLTSKSIII